MSSSSFTAAAQAVRDTMKAATSLQTRMAIPVQQDYFMPDDLGVDAEVDPTAVDADIVSDVEDSEDDEAEEADEEPAAKRSKRGGAGPSSDAAALKPAKADDGSDSDGYGAKGLSWEAVLKSVQVCSPDLDTILLHGGVFT